MIIYRFDSSGQQDNPYRQTHLPVPTPDHMSLDRMGFLQPIQYFRHNNILLGIDLPHSGILEWQPDSNILQDVLLTDHKSRGVNGGQSSTIDLATPCLMKLNSRTIGARTE